MRSVADWLFWSVGLLAFTVGALGGLALAIAWAWEKWVETARVHIWCVRFIRHWSAFNEWHKATRGRDPSEGEPEYVPPVANTEARPE